MKQITMLRKKANRKNAKTIHEISPEWARLLARLEPTREWSFYREGQILNIADCKFCVVGEAYGFKDDYQDQGTKDFCWKCYSCSINFANCLENSPSSRKSLVDDFVNHWNKSHI